MTKTQLEGIVAQCFEKIIGLDSQDTSTGYKLSNLMKRRLPLHMWVTSEFHHSPKTGRVYLVVKFYEAIYTTVISCCLTNYTKKVPERYLNQ